MFPWLPNEAEEIGGPLKETETHGGGRRYSVQNFEQLESPAPGLREQENTPPLCGGGADT